MTPEQYEEKKQAKIERLRELASKNKIEANNLFKEAEKMASVIPFGQPILVGHHSEKRDRNYRERIHNKFGKAYETQDKAEYYENRAKNAENNNAIFSDDPLATEKIADKIERLENNQRIMKQANKIIRQSISDAQKIDALVNIGLREEIAMTLLKPDCFGGLGFARFRLTNNSANINRLKKRMGHIEKLNNDKTTEKEVNGIRIVENVEDNRLQIFFPSIPSEDIRKQLKQSGFKWSPNNGCWQRFRSSVATYRAEEIIKNIN